MIGSTNRDINLVIVDRDNYEVGSPIEIIQDIRSCLTASKPDIIKANHKMLVDSMFSECHDEIDQAIYNKLQEIGDEIES